MKLIDADALHDALRAKQKWIVKRENMVNEGYTYDQVHFAIDDMPTVDAIPIEWIQKKIQIIEETGDFYSSAVLVEMIEGWRTEE